jgi:hypothetical protein
MNQDDLIIQREVRRILDKRPIDTTLAVITHSKGFISVGGHLRALRSQPFVKVHDEIAQFQTMVMRNMPTIKGVTIEARIIDLPQKKKETAPTETTTPVHGSTTASPSTRH